MRRVLLFSLAAVFLIAVGGFVASAFSSVAVLASNVQTDMGALNLPIGTHLGTGFEGKVAVMTNGAYIDVGFGPVWYEEGTEIDCEDPAPGYPDPCDPY